MTQVKQCKTCPWKTGNSVDDIPGYDREMHEKLASTCISGMMSLASNRAMACHYSKHDDAEYVPCAGWIHNQLGPGNNIMVRLAVMSGTLPEPVVDGDQRETFEETFE